MKKNHILLVLLSLFLIVLNVVWLAIDTRPPSWDASVHLNLTWKYWQIFKDLKISFLKDIISVSGYYPPLFHLTTVPLFALLGPSLSSALTINLFYLLVLLFSTYLIGKKLYDGRVGLLSAFLVCLYPFVLFMSRTLVLDLALTSVVALGSLLYLKSENFSKRNYSILFGIICGLGMLIKWTYCFFLIGPVLYSFCTSKRKINFGMAVFSAAIVAVPWYSYNLIKFIKYSIQFSTIGASEGDPAVVTMSSLFYYGKNLLLQIQPVFLVLFLVGLTVFLFTFRKHNKLLLWWIIIPYLVLTLISNKDERYTLPFLPAISIISSFWLFSLKNVFVRRVVVGGLVLFGVGQGVMNQPPHHENWQQEEVLSFINREKTKEFATVSVVANHSYWHSESLDFCAKRLGMPLLFNGFGSNLGQFADFVITKSGDLGPSFTLGQISEARTEMLEEKSHFRRNFVLIKTVPLPDDSELFVFKRMHPSLRGKSNFGQNVFVEKLLNGLMKYFYEFQGLSVEIAAENNEKAAQGVFEKIVVSADQLKIKNIVIREAKIAFHDVELDLPLLMEKETLRIFAVREIEPVFTITSEDLKNILLAKAKIIKNPAVIIEDGVVYVEGQMKDVGVKLAASLHLSNNVLRPDIFQLKYGFFVIPSWFYESIAGKPVSLAPTAEWPVYTKIKAITLQDNKIAIR